MRRAAVLLAFALVLVTALGCAKGARSESASTPSTQVDSTKKSSPTTTESEPPEVVVPDVVNMEEGPAISVMEAAGLQVEREDRYGSLEYDTVVSQAPAPGVRVAPGSTVRLAVQMGPLPVEQATGADLEEGQWLAIVWPDDPMHRWEGDEPVSDVLSGEVLEISSGERIWLTTDEVPASLYEAGDQVMVRITKVEPEDTILWKWRITAEVYTDEQ